MTHADQICNPAMTAISATKRSARYLPETGTALPEILPRPPGNHGAFHGRQQPWLSRYTDGPNDWDRPNLEVCVHAFVGKAEDGTVDTCQILPWDYRAWHCGGDANNTHLAFEICEDDLQSCDYFQAAYAEAVRLTAQLCREFEFNPLADGVVIDHAEGYRRGWPATTQTWGIGLAGLARQWMIFGPQWRQKWRTT